MEAFLFLVNRSRLHSGDPTTTEPPVEDERTEAPVVEEQEAPASDEDGPEWGEAEEQVAPEEDQAEAGAYRHRESFCHCCMELCLGCQRLSHGMRQSLVIIRPQLQERKRQLLMTIWLQLAWWSLQAVSLRLQFSDGVPSQRGPRVVTVAIDMTPTCAGLLF